VEKPPVPDATELAPWKGAGPKPWSVALPGLEEFLRLSSGGFSIG